MVFIGFIISTYDTYYWTFGAPNNRWISAIIYPISRIIWAISIATIIWMCVTGNGELVNNFLSWKFFIFLSRLTFSVYLTHICIVWIYWGSKRELQDLNSVSIVSLLTSNLLLSYLFGFVFSVLFESPITYFQNYLIDYLFIKNNNSKDCVEMS